VPSHTACARGPAPPPPVLGPVGDENLLPGGNGVLGFVAASGGPKCVHNPHPPPTKKMETRAFHMPLSWKHGNMDTWKHGRFHMCLRDKNPPGGTLMRGSTRCVRGGQWSPSSRGCAGRRKRRWWGTRGGHGRHWHSCPRPVPTA